MASSSTFGIVKSKTTQELLHQDIWAYVQENVEEWGDMPAYVCAQTERSYTYEDLRRGSANWAATFLALAEDSSKPPPVVVMSTNCIEVNVIILGALRIGSRLHIINYDLPLDVICEQVENSEANIMISDIGALCTVKKAIEKMTKKIRIFTSGIDNSLEESTDRITKDTNLWASYEQKKVDPESVAFVFLSSGTTGRPKGIATSHKNMVNLIAYFNVQEFHPHDGGVQPLHLVLGTLAHLVNNVLALATICSGGGALIVPNLDANDIVSVIKKFKPVSIHTRPNLLDFLSKAEVASVGVESLRLIVNVGSSISSTTTRRLKQRFGENVVLRNWYGTTEITAAAYSIINPETPNEMDLMSNVEIRIVDNKTGQSLPPNQIGEIYLRTPLLMLGYYKNPEATKVVVDSEKWYRTGDTGYYTEDGRLGFFERAGDIIEVYGKMITPMDIEKVLLEHLSVLDVGVAGVPDTEAGELPIAFVIKSKPEVSEEELVSYVNDRVEHEKKLAKGVRFVDSLPRNHMGKLERKYLKQMAWKIQT